MVQRQQRAQKQQQQQNRVERTEHLQSEQRVTEPLLGYIELGRCGSQVHMQYIIVPTHRREGLLVTELGSSTAVWESAVGPFERW